MSRNDLGKGGDMFLALASLFPNEKFLCVGYNKLAKVPFKNYKLPPLIPKIYNNIETPKNLVYVDFEMDPKKIYTKIFADLNRTRPNMDRSKD